MSEPVEYVDVRELIPGYDRHVCPTSGEVEWFKPTDNGPICWDHRDYLRRQIEVPCPVCDTRMVGDGEAWVCHHCGTERERDKEGLIDRLSTDVHATRGMAGVLMGECPICGSDTGVNGDPDGCLICQDCVDFYAGRFSDEWYAYAHWMRGEMDVRINEDNAL